jgi:hypothetical protein
VKSCPKCGAALLDEDKMCPKCGADIAPAAKPELVERLSIEMTIISERGFTFRIRNSGTAPLTVARVIYCDQPAQVVSVTSEKGTVKDNLLTLQPGDVGEVTFRTSYNGISGVMYSAVIITESGKQYETSILFP